MIRALLTPRLFDGDRWRGCCAVLLDGHMVRAIVGRDDIPPGTPCLELAGGFLAPGFIDIQVNGGGGVLLNNSPDRAGIERMVAAHRATGTTAMLPTVISDTPAVQRAAAMAVRAAMAAGNSGVLGIHIEGPFFAAARRGTHRADMIREPSSEDLRWLAALASEVPTVVTLAPEHLPAGAIATLTAAGVRVCAGHTDASYQQIAAARAEGLRGFTHLFNAMSPLASREPGAVGAALDGGDCWAGIIADGHHVHPASIRVAQRALPAGKLCLVTDAMATVGDSRDWFELYGERIEVRGGRLVNAEGALAGSAIGMIDAVRYCHREVGLPLVECLRMASRYPATFLGEEHRLGRIAPGYRADLLHLDNDLRVLDTWAAGQHQSHLQAGGQQDQQA
ncbi:N-acetylglucosamine-6-phosphate deacetylase [Parahaliea mediterranea]|uniref:N-acetylglucosamine-6-phosphate deacetylase n=1 Tax=Parahaliea mediterranea TaxID=651086 RepID=A0A939DB81_9GAMM|nr:N-acetylglucosamine-6-phosphate deacetylase [Parahaliea mediterranea]MBN7795058.1 N-acetylglucosamine-6-phosphate deacetylase [Parahaliea mediterranea]